MHNPLREWAKSRDEKYPELALMLGVSLRQFNGILSGERLPSIPILANLQRMSNLSWEQIMLVFVNYRPPKTRKTPLRHKVKAAKRPKPLPPSCYKMYSEKLKTWVALFRDAGRLYLYRSGENSMVRPNIWVRVRQARPEDIQVFAEKTGVPIKRYYAKNTCPEPDDTGSQIKFKETA